MSVVIERLPVLLVSAGLVALLGGCASNNAEPEPVVALPPSAPLKPAPMAARIKAQLDLADGYIAVGDAARARPALERALELDSRNSTTHDLFGRLYQMQGDAELAEHHFRIAVRSDGSNARARNDYGVFLYQQGRYPDAVEQLARAADDPDSPSRPVAYENLGLASLKAGDRSGARSAFTRAVMLDRRMPISLLELAEISFMDGEFENSANWYQRYRGVASRQSARSLWLGVRLARAAGNKDQEASYALQLKNLFPLSAEYQSYRGSVDGG